ncbi:PREDICTED: phosphatidylcholine transfer protein-like isoform X2 [Camelina sativa]|uniref:Phosphatidylcholine transfer protein-like isoform X2 n=1 Tax=Camelina sativa TaxID=90675 RepID=A0ABM0V2B0_CAMSA|nr:PREDICTED: phosphatidylcholine transfer protein-like isoform X2 [Camelina sativa]
MKSLLNWALSFFSDQLSRRDGYIWATAISLLLILLFHILFSSKFRFFSSSPTDPVSHAVISQSRLVADEDLKFLIEKLEERNESDDEIWEHVIHRSNDRISYTAKRSKPKDGGPMKYLSVTVFEDCSAEILRDFYMDNDYRKQWDKTVVDHEQLQVDTITGVESGRTVKKFPLLTSREYLLAWRLWQGKDKFYCFTKECDHNMVPKQRKYVRVSYFRSGWRIRQVPGRNACEIKMFHQENAGLNVEMAKLAFSKGIWSYICKMDNALCKYMATSQGTQQGPILSAVTLIKKVRFHQS